MGTARSDRHAAWGRAIRELRVERGLSQERLSLDAGLDRTYVSGVERGERNPTLANLLKLGDVLGVRLSEVAARAEGVEEGGGR